MNVLTKALLRYGVDDSLTFAERKKTGLLPELLTRWQIAELWPVDARLFEILDAAAGSGELRTTRAYWDVRKKLATTIPENQELPTCVRWSIFSEFMIPGEKQDENYILAFAAGDFADWLSLIGVEISSDDLIWHWLRMHGTVSRPEIDATKSYGSPALEDVNNSRRKPATREQVVNALRPLVNNPKQLETLFKNNSASTKWLIACKLDGGYDLKKVIKAHLDRGLLKDEYQQKYSENHLEAALSIDRP